MNFEFDDVIFVGGTGRSGTTIMGKLISRHSHVALAKPLEIKFLTGGTGLLDLYRNPWISRAGKLNLVANGNLSKFKNSIEQKWWDRQSKDGSRSGLHRGIERALWDALVVQLEQDLQQDRLSACRRFMRNFIDLQKLTSGASRWIDTTPTNLIRRKEIAYLLPGARFIHVIRDGRDVASSIVHEKWGPNNPTEGLRWWRSRLRMIINQCQPKDSRLLHIWVEDLVEDNRDESFQKVMDFLCLQSENRINRYFLEKVTPDRLHRNRWVNEVKDSIKFNMQYEKIFYELIKKGRPSPTKKF
jgi:hypothetical protein